MADYNGEDIQKEFDELFAKAKETYPDLEEAIQAFNSTSVPTEEYRNYLNLTSETPFSTSSNHVPIQ